MYLTEKEINLEFESIGRSVWQTLEHRESIKAAFDGKRRCWFVGSGSSFCLAKSAASLMLLRCGIDSYAVAAGDLMLHFEKYEQVLQESVVVFLSRSGSTTEVIEAAKLIKSKLASDCVSICAKSVSELNSFCGLNICIPWAFDDSVCQTKTVGSLYACIAAITAVVCGDDELLGQLSKLPESEKDFRAFIEPIVREVAEAGWEHVVVLADSELFGLMEEGALAYKEICQLNSNCYNVLDVRHGPMVMINENSFVVLLLDKPGKVTDDLIADIKAKGALCAVFSSESRSTAANEAIALPCQDPAVSGIYALYFLQLVALHKALHEGINPDEPDGLSAWVKIS